MIGSLSQLLLFAALLAASNEYATVLKYVDLISRKDSIAGDLPASNTGQETHTYALAASRLECHARPGCP